jgi:hypothetical protein
MSNIKISQDILANAKKIAAEFLSSEEDLIEVAEVEPGRNVWIAKSVDDIIPLDSFTEGGVIIYIGTKKN